ncbi:MAG: NUDIX hydrolase [bacterium]|nr:NUDIX hydrolase [bacterium]
MAFVTDEAIDLMAIKYDEPEEAHFHIPVSPEEHDRIHASQKMERNHDVTLYIQKEDKFIVIAKHMYPPGLFRAPSGGLIPGEQFEVGAKREAYEETGCRIELVKFLLRTEVQFETIVPRRGGNGDNNQTPMSLYWRSFVFLARWTGGDLKFIDINEIRECKLASLSEFDRYSEIMRSTTIGGLHYRAALHDVVKGHFVS